MASANADTVRSGYEAFAAGDVPKVLGLFDPAIEWTVPLAHVWTLREGKVTRFHEYTDNVALRQHALS
jgi:ketosteroid isomerase-like protein